MIELLISTLVPTLAIIVGIFYLWRKIPELMQQAINDIGGQLKETFAEPNVKRAMSILGQKSGDVRADTALRTKAAEAFVSQSPVIEKILDQFGFSPLEGIKLYNDPIFGPMIQQAIGSFIKGSGQGSSGGLP